MATLPYVTPANIVSQSWSLELDSTAGGGSGSGIGGVVQGINDIHQCLKIIMTTQPGEDPFRPTFGVDLTEFLDQPVNSAKPGIISQINSALTKWEPRIIIQQIQVGYNPSDNIAKLSVTVYWKPNLGNNTTVPSTIGAQATTVNIGVN